MSTEVPTASLMPTGPAPGHATRAATLRVELKQWEKDFAAANGGRKAGKEDIKTNGAVAAKYKEYEKLKQAQSGLKRRSPRQQERAQLATPSKQRKRRHEHSYTPKQHVDNPPLYSGHEEEEETHHETPSIMRTFVGPTPQKDGRVLGLFDIMPEKSTPTKARQTRSALVAVSGNASNLASPSAPGLEPSKETPRKQQQNEAGYAPDMPGSTPSATPTKRGRGRSRTPQSAGKRYLLSTFAGTPVKRRRVETATPRKQEPALAFSTPAFLRRDSQPLAPMPVVAEDEHDSGDGLDVSSRLKGPGTSETIASPAGRRSVFAWQRPRFGTLNRIAPLRKTLSSMIAEIRKAEDDRMDEELDILREIEDEREHAPELRRQATEVQVEDSQSLSMLGPDGGRDSEEERGGEEPAQPHRRWKKKGQKRQTRRVIMRPRAPLKHNPTPSEAPVLHGDSDEDDAFEQEDGNAIAVAETQAAAVQEDELDTDHSDAEKDVAPSSTAAAPPKSDNGQHHKATEKQNGGAQKAVRKISATAHANFRKLKIKSRGSSKGKRFGRFGGRGR